MHGASVYNILSSNIINVILYSATIVYNKNLSKLRNGALITDIILVLITIMIPIFLLKLNIGLNFSIVPLFLILYFFFSFLNNNVHKKFLKKSINDEIIVNEDKEIKKVINSKTITYFSIILISGILLFVISNLLGDTLDNLCNNYYIPEKIIGVLLGVITSLPEFITFFESQKYYKEKSDETLGVVEATNNLLTSNILNLFVIQTIGILIKG